jgi:UDP-N-acetylmuramate-alanine ligase
LDLFIVILTYFVFLFREAGYDVAGCDIAFYPPMGDYLKKVGVECISVEMILTSM